MAINYSNQVYRPTYDVFARPVVFTPTQSQSSVGSYQRRGIYSTQPVDMLTEDDAIFSDARTILDILDDEFDVVPIQGDHLNIPTSAGMPALGDFEVIDVVVNGGGETTLSIRKLLPAKP